MNQLKELEKYLNYEFSSGPYTGKDYKTFQTKYVNYLKQLCKDNDWQLARVLKNHYEFSAFIEYDGKFAYLAIVDVRYWKNELWNNILIRTANHKKDYRGGRNDYTSLPDLQDAIAILLNMGRRTSHVQQS